MKRNQNAMKNWRIMEKNCLECLHQDLNSESSDSEVDRHYSSSASGNLLLPDENQTNIQEENRRFFRQS